MFLSNLKYLFSNKVQPSNNLIFWHSEPLKVELFSYFQSYVAFQWYMFILNMAKRSEVNMQHNMCTIPVC